MIAPVMPWVVLEPNRQRTDYIFSINNENKSDLMKKYWEEWQIWEYGRLILWSFGHKKNKHTWDDEYNQDMK